MAFTCPRCGIVSHNPNDEREGYCGRCHDFTGERLIASEPTPGQRITELHCWVATYADGTEGIIAGGLEGLGMTPLLSSRRRVAVSMEALARHVADLSQSTPNKVMRVRLVTFTSMEGTRQ